MFGIYMLGLYLIARLIKVILDCKGESDWKKQSKEKGYPLWVDRHGTAHHIENDEPFMYVTDYKTGELLEKNPYTGEIKRNITKEERARLKRESYEKAVANGDNLYPVGRQSDDYHQREPKYCEDGKKYIWGRRWIDRNTNKVYVRRKLGINTMWYLNIDTGLYEFPDKKCVGEYNAGYINGKFDYFIYTEENIAATKEILNKHQTIAIERDGMDSFASKYSVWHNDKVV